MTVWRRIQNASRHDYGRDRDRGHVAPIRRQVVLRVSYAMDDRS